MRIFFLCFLFTSILSPAFGETTVGSSAPEFELQGSDGKAYTLSQFRDKKSVVIAFFPKVFTGG